MSFYETYISKERELTGSLFMVNVATLPSIDVSTRDEEEEVDATA